MTAPDPAPTASPARTVIDAAGPAFLASAYAGRLPAAMNQLGLLLVVSAAGRGLALAGSSVAAVGLGTAALAAVIGRLVDRHGPLPVLAVAVLAQTAGLGTVLLALARDLPDAVVLAGAALTGAANPQVPSVARATWSRIGRSSDPARGARAVRLGLGYETAADETSFVIGPVAAGGLVSLLGAEGAALALIVLTAVGEGLFALWLLGNPALARPEHRGGARTAETAPAGATALRAVSSARPGAPVAALLTTILAIGLVFGVTQTALTAVNASRGTPGLTGPVYGCMGLTSGILGLVSAGIRLSVPGRLALGGAAVALGSLVLMSVPGTGPTVVVMLVMGAGVGLTLATCYTALEVLAPTGRVTALMTMGATANVLGVSAGSVLTGLIGTDLHRGNAPGVVAGAAVLVASLALRRARRP